MKSSLERRSGIPSQQFFTIAGVEQIRSAEPRRIGLLIQNCIVTATLAQQMALGIGFGPKPNLSFQTMYLEPGDKIEFNCVPTTAIWIYPLNLATLAISTVAVGALILETVEV